MKPFGISRDNFTIDEDVWSAIAGVHLVNLRRVSNRGEQAERCHKEQKRNVFHKVFRLSDDLKCYDPQRMLFILA